MQKLLTAAFATAALLVVAPAHAQPPYPGVVQDYLSAVRPPPCRVCHANGATGFGTVATPFGIFMMSKGMKAFDADSVRDALNSLILAPHHSDKDRKSPDDIEVLRRGGDPNDLNPDYVIGAPEYGCGGATFVGRRSTGGGAVLAVVLGLVIARRRRRSRLRPTLE